MHSAMCHALISLSLSLSLSLASTSLSLCVCLSLCRVCLLAASGGGRRQADSSHGSTGAAPAAELSSPVRSLPLSPLICLCLLRLDRAFSCVSSQRLEEVGADRQPSCGRRDDRLQWLTLSLCLSVSVSPLIPLSLSLSLSFFRPLQFRPRSGDPKVPVSPAREPLP